MTFFFGEMSHFFDYIGDGCISISDLSNIFKIMLTAALIP